MSIITVKNKRGTAAEWASANPILADGELGFERDTNVVKIGDGVKRWNQLKPANNGVYLPAATNMLVIFGTSIEAGNDATNGTQAKGPFAHANVILGHRFRVVYNAGISGNDSAQMLARIQSDVIAKTPGWAYVGSGCPNDIGHGLTLPQAIANHKAIYDTLKAAGIRLIVATPTPYGLNDTTGNRQYVSGLRKWIMTYCREQGHIVADIYAALIDPTGTGDYASTYSPDHIHPGPPGALAAGKAIAAAVTRAAVPDMAGVWLPNGNADPYNLVPNGLGTGTTGSTKPTGVTGNLATSWLAFNNGGTSAGTLAKVARTDGIAGEWQQFQATAGNADGFKFELQNTNVNVDFHTGDTVLAVWEFQTDQDWVGGLDLNLLLWFYPNGTNQQTDLFRSGADVGIGQPAASGVLMVAGVVPSDCTRIQPQIYCKMTTGTMRAGRVGLYNLTTLAAAGIYTIPAAGEIT